jgi:hypothetical protein
VCSTGGQTDCGTACYDLSSDMAHCGACNHACQSGIACIAGACNCPAAGPTDCGGTCVNLMTNAAHCGACANNCGPGGTCSGGACTCGTGFTLCNGSCVDVTTSHDNCATCGHACSSTQACVASACVVPPLYHGWTSPISGCSTTSFNAMTATADGGQYPYNTGDSDACRAWKLAATICVDQPTPVGDTSAPNNDWHCATSGGFTDPRFGTYCAQTDQDVCTDFIGACNVDPIIGVPGPLSVHDCTGIEVTQM